MSGQGNRLKAEAHQLLVLADQLAEAFDRPDRLVQRLVGTGAFAGPLADETIGALTGHRRTLGLMADQLRDEAAERLRRARHLENHDSVAEDLADLVTGRDVTPWW